ncbi:MAG: A/G-specific adenine glycosylase [Lachnospiraceae bacterium]|nr:A/G-specific adenine glycosylase [Lachnospiraceae bacterium]MCI1727815.1 A/G-specific adenine glycosylase [Lachnospiraceae bacterium]
MQPEVMTEEKLDLPSGFVRPLILWYNQNARDLPWRRTKDPYRIWVSEIMLQQTRIEAVMKYYVNFIGRLPTMKNLAECPEEELLKLWEGLGYYSRVRNMQKTAQAVSELPADYEELKKLPGIGSYTAAAVASIAFSVPQAAVDGNVLRVVSRLCGSSLDVMEPKTRRLFEEKLTAILKQKKADPGAFNQALMEVGETICLPNTEPQCGKCPLKNKCRAFREGTASEIPVRIRKMKRRTEERTVLLLEYEGKTAIRKRPEKGLLAGLYEFPNLPGKLSEEEIAGFALEAGFRTESIIPLADAGHIFSHLEWKMHGYAVELKKSEAKQEDSLIFIEPGQLEKSYAMPGAFDAYRRIMEERAAGEKKLTVNKRVRTGK